MSTFFYVKPGFGRWHVAEATFEKSLAYFDSENEARDYALAMARTKSGSIVQVLDERGDVVEEVPVDMATAGGGWSGSSALDEAGWEALRQLGGGAARWPIADHDEEQLIEAGYAERGEHGLAMTGEGRAALERHFTRGTP